MNKWFDDWLQEWLTIRRRSSDSSWWLWRGGGGEFWGTEAIVWEDEDDRWKWQKSSSLPAISYHVDDTNDRNHRHISSSIDKFHYCIISGSQDEVEYITGFISGYRPSKTQHRQLFF